MLRLTRPQSIRCLAISGLALVVLVGGYTAWNWSSFQARYTASQFRSAETPEAKAALAANLLARGEAAWPSVMQELRSENAADRGIMAQTLIHYLNGLPEQDPTRIALLQQLIVAMVDFSPAGKAELVELVPAFLGSGHPEAASRSRDVVAAALAVENNQLQMHAIRLALRPEIDLAPAIMPLLKAPDADVRRIAMLVIGPVKADQSPVIETEELFPWLHDPDAEVRQLCRSALLTRGLDTQQITYAQLLSDDRTTERLKLLTDLRFATDTSRVGQWLERLSRDPEPAVRIGSARVAAELQLSFVNWIARLAEQDPDATVRRWATYYQQEVQRIKQTGFDR